MTLSEKFALSAMKKYLDKMYSDRTDADFVLVSQHGTEFKIHSFILETR